MEFPTPIQVLDKLVILNLKDCRRLKNPPTGIRSKYLREVILSGCSNLRVAPNISCNVVWLYLDGTAIKELPLIEYPSRLVTLDLSNCSNPESLPESICELKCLESLNLSGCWKIESLPRDLGNLEALLNFKVDDNVIREEPPSIVRLNKQQELSLRRCKGDEVIGLILPPLSGLNILPDSLSRLSSLERFYLSKNNFESIPESIKDLSKLYNLNISCCERLQRLLELPSGQHVVAYHFCSLPNQ